MGANTHMQGVFSKGYVSTGTALGWAIAGIDPLPGYRVAVSNFGYDTGNGLEYLCFHKVIGTGTIRSTNIASGATNVVFTGSTIFNSAELADVDASVAYITIPLQNGKYQHACVYQYWASTDTVVIETALTASVAAGATCWAFNIHGANISNMCYQFAAASAGANVSDYGGPGMFYGKSAGDPMVVTMYGTQIGAITYINGQYITA